MINNFRDQLIKDLKNAYRKWKSATYFDPFLITEANKLAFFELEENILESDLFFENFADELSNPVARENLFNQILLSIGVRCYPKNSSPINTSQGNSKNNLPKKYTIDKALYMVDLPVKAHILGALWTMKFGIVIDKKLSSHCFGNRIRETIVNNGKSDESGPSPYLYYPYFKKYVSWRDEGLNVLEKILDLNLNAVMITLDIKNYFYNCRVSFGKLIAELDKSIAGYGLEEINNYNFLHSLIEGVFKNYSQLFEFKNESDAAADKNPFIPIGFLPSYVISNWYLSEFDKAVKEKINPQYYGRYVDDILLVFSVNENVANEREILSSLLSRSPEVFLKVTSDSEDEKIVYEISANCLRETSRPLLIEEQKIKVFYFSHLHSRVMIETFKRTILNHSSSFLYLHESTEDVLSLDQPDFWKIDYSDTHNKLRSVEDIAVDKFHLSKWLSFLVNYSGSISGQDLIKVEKTLFDTLNSSGYLSSFNLWEKYLTFFFQYSRYLSIKRFCDEVMREISEIPLSDRASLSKNSIVLKTRDDVVLLKKTLFDILAALLQKVFCLKADPDVASAISQIAEDVAKERSSDDFSLFKDGFRKAYLQSYMFNAQIVFYSLSKMSVNYSGSYDLLNNDSDFFYRPNYNIDHLKYFPKYIHFHEVQMFTLGYPHQKNDINQKAQNYKTVWDNFWRLNYGFNGSIPENKFIEVIRDEKPCSPLNVGLAEIHVDRVVSKAEIVIGLANVNVDFKDFEDTLMGVSSISDAPRNKAADIINSAIKEKVDFLVLPESYIHYKWIGKMIRVARDHQMGMVFGLKHIADSQNNVCNYIVTLLPFKMNGFNNCAIEIRLKNHYSPAEKKYIEGYFRKVPNQTKSYTMYNWKGMSFAPYCCFEIASIEDRALFKSKIDTAVVIEWNKDVEYFSNIIESMSRDLHCYCVQVNSSQYGDSRITQPAQSYQKDIVRAKGGRNDYLIVEKIDIRALRKFQLQDYGLQESQGKYKPTPPGFEPKDVKNR